MSARSTTAPLDTVQHDTARLDEIVRGFRLVDVLQERADAMEHRPKRARTRAAIIAATAQVMEQSGIDGLTVAKVAGAAGLAHGTFYLYFANRIAAAMAVRRFYSAAMRRFRPRGSGHLPAFAAILRMNRFYVASYAANADLLRALHILLCTRPEYALWRDRVNHSWSRAILRDLARRLPGDASQDRARQMLLVRSAIAMVDETLREIYVHRGPNLTSLAASDEEVARFISLSWYRVLYGADPPS